VPTSVICPDIPRYPLGPAVLPEGGYTLLELLVVMALLGLLAGFALPRLYTLYDSAAMSFEKERILAQITRLGYLARHGRVPLVMEGTLRAPVEGGLLDLPPGWEVTADRPLVYQANGVCNGGILTLTFGERSQRWLLEPPLCPPRPL
jgi:general secretion pathway protein G